MGEYLNRQGFSCLGIRLSGHATSIEDMRRSRWTDWAASVEDGYHLLTGCTDHIFLAGLSMGGVLSLLMSTRLTPPVAGLVAMSTPFALPRDRRNYPVWLIKLYGRLVKFAPKSGEVPGASWFDKGAFADHISYSRNPVASVAELKTLLSEMRSALPEIRKPVLLIHSRDDVYVLPENMEQIYAGLVNAPDKTRVYVSGSGHVVTRDAVRVDVFRAVEDFIHKVEMQIES